jgi:UDPglucose 6-dehydrogenase
MEKALEYKLLPPSVKLVASPLEAVEGAEALLLATEWKEFARQDFAAIKGRMHTPLVFDGRNHLNPKTMREMGFVYYGVGRP